MTDFIIDLMVIIWLTILIYLFLSELYFRSRRFKAIKRKIDTYTKECNELNDHIEAMKNVDLGFVSTYNGELKCSNPNINSEYLKYNRTTYKCSSDTLDRAQKNPFKYIHKYFNVEFNEKTLERLENTLNDFLAVEEGKEKLKRQREEIIKSISSELPFIIRNFTGIQRLSRKLGFKDIDLKDSYFPKLTFRYRSHQGRVNKAYDFIFNIENLNDLIEYLSKKIKFKKSVAGQRALMTPKLRDEIKARDNNACQICGLSTKDEPNLLLEIDHIIPLSKGGMTAEDNLQTLCWKCNRSKGSKIYRHI